MDSSDFCSGGCPSACQQRGGQWSSNQCVVPTYLDTVSLRLRSINDTLILDSEKYFFTTLVDLLDMSLSKRLTDPALAIPTRRWWLTSMRSTSITRLLLYVNGAVFECSSC